jgi:hypothetical protein
VFATWPVPVISMATPISPASARPRRMKLLVTVVFTADWPTSEMGSRVRLAH